MRKNLILLSTIIIIFGCDTSESLNAQSNICSAIVTWEAPTERTNGEPLTTEELDKFTIFVSKNYDVEKENLVAIVDIRDTNIITWEIDGLPKGRKYFYMTATDKLGNESAYSNILSKVCK